MVQLRTYNKLTGDVLRNITATVANGRLDYIGNSQFVTTEVGVTNQFAVQDTSTIILKTLITFGVNEDGYGVAIQRRQLMGDVEDSLEPEGQILYVAMDEIIAAVHVYAIRLYDIATAPATLLATINLGEVNDWGGICTDGHRVYVAFNVGALPATNRIALYEIEGGTATQLKSWSVTTLAADLCHDGYYLWAIEGTNAVQYEQVGNAAPVQVNSFALAGNTQRGITTDGQNIFVLSRG